MRNSDISKLLLATAVTVLIGTGARANELMRLDADYFKFDGTQFSTSITANATKSPDGALFYRKHVRVPHDSNVLYVTFYAAGAVHGGPAEWISCRVNGAFCRPSSSPLSSQTPPPPGWVGLEKLPDNSPAGTVVLNCATGGDCHYNGISYSWCVGLPPKRGDTITVDLKMASSIDGKFVFLLHGHVYIDSSFISGKDRCVAAPAISATAASESGDALDLALKAAAKEAVATTVHH